MELLSLELSENENHEIYNNIRIITNIDESDINIELSSTDDGNIKIRYFTNNKINKREYIEKITAKITKLLVEYTKLVGIKILKENYFYFDEEEVGSIISDIEEEIDNDIKIHIIIKNKFKEVIEKSNSINTVDEKELDEAKDLLIQQRPLVMAYITDGAPDIMINEEADMALVWSGEAVSAMAENENLDFVIPKEGSNIWIDAMVVPANSENQEMAERFIDFLCSTEATLRNINEVWYLSLIHI